MGLGVQWIGVKGWWLSSSSVVDSATCSRHATLLSSPQLGVMRWSGQVIRVGDWICGSAGLNDIPYE